ncbi:Propeptide PepSY amd peptidase M4 [Bacillus cereus]|uniref:PepSY domain-containing protein n=1 Tax=Bacillus cereus TaxID=1396 RepID=UPI00086449AB|nr:PepSY domain-containing protein [Bacillus cereus]SCN00690.1 Propeptide PepSY amd peptidase M4 [Bacillus cereus]
MSWKGLVAGLGVGFAAGYLVANKVQEQSHISSEKALKMVKQALKMVKQALSHKGEITGSWVHMVPETFEKYDVAYEVYRGGLTTMLDDIQERFEFLVDAKTGTVLEVIAA